MAAPWRRIVREQLELLASENEQREYESNVPHVDITRELVCLWLGDSYHPDDRDFRSCFSDEELGALVQFNDILNARIDRLPPSNGTVEAWLASPEWREVMRAASEALQCMSDIS